MIVHPNPISLGNIKRLLLAGRERLRRREVSLMDLVCGGCGTPSQLKRKALGRSR